MTPTHGAVTRFAHSRCRTARTALCLAALVAGCAAPRASLVDCPLSAEQQQQVILEVVPKGSLRSDAERRLKAAGIEYTAGQKNSIYYLSLWNRPDGKRWHINVALLFDSQGKLYQTRVADSVTEPLTDEALAGLRRQAEASRPADAADREDELANVPFPDQLQNNGRQK